MNVQTIFLQTALIAAVTTAIPAMADFGTGPSQPLDREINSVLHLESSWHTTLWIDETLEQPISVRIPIGNMTYTLELEPKSTRSEAYQVLMQDDNGELYEVPAGPIRTLRGSITELNGSVAAGSLMDDGLYARIKLGNGQEVWLEPMSEKIDGVSSTLYALYYTHDIIPSGGTCAAEDHMHVDDVLGMLANYTANSTERGTIICTAQLGVDTDYEYYQDWGSQTESRINQVINSVNVQYEDEVQLTHLITTIIVRSSSSDPYTTTDAGSFLDQFGTEWNNNQGSIPRDVAHLFTGKNLAGGTIGIAWLGVVCYTSSAYGLVESDCCGSFGCTTDLSAHEIGHNWGAGHVENPSFNTMYPSLTCANLFAASSISTINAYANGSNCLSCENQAPTGACCIGDSCVVMYQSQCDGGGGAWQGDNTTCDVNPCVAATGACCVDNACETLSSEDCYLSNGTYNGDSVSCASVSCSPGACCVDQTCSVTLEANCSGSWFGEDTTCADITCGAGADYLNYEMRTWSSSLGQSMVTYDLYFPSTDPNTLMTAVFGNADTLELHGWSNALFDGSAYPTALHQSSLGADVAHDRSWDSLGGVDLVYDSFVAIGSDDSAYSAAQTLGFDSVGFNSSTGLVMNDGLWFIVPSDPAGALGQGTALGHRVGSFSVEAGQGLDVLLNVQWNDGSGAVHQSTGIYWNNLGLEPEPACVTDINGDSFTNVDDLLMLISAWGPCNGCASDIDGSGTVDVDDLLMVISAWGPCSPPETFNVSVDGSTFTPSILDVRRGDTIIWTRNGGNHTVTSGDNCTADGIYFDAPLNVNNPVFTWVVPTDASSNIPYFCVPHCNFGQEGEINVID